MFRKFNQITKNATVIDKYLKSMFNRITERNIRITEQNLNFEIISSSTSYLEYQAGGGKGLVDLVNQLTLERCHSF